MENRQNTKVDWDFIIETIQEEKCVLLLGPDIFTGEDGGSLHDDFYSKLALENSDKILAYYKDDGFFLFKDTIAKTRIISKIKNYYKQPFPTQIYEKIAQIPFNLIICVTPDNILDRQFKNSNLPHEFEYFAKYKNPLPLKSPTKNQPLIYNLFGNILDEESLVLSHDDLFEYLQSILGGNSLPDELKKTLKTANNYIFLGFQFDKWYVQLLLRLLNLHDERYKFARFAASQRLNKETHTLCVTHFKIEFVNKDITDFIDNLHNHCNTAGVLRKVDTVQLSFSEQIKKKIEAAQIEEALEMMQAHTKDKDDDLYSEVIGLSGRYSRVQRKINQNVIEPKDAEITINQINYAILDLLKEFKD